MKKSGWLLIGTAVLCTACLVAYGVSYSYYSKKPSEPTRVMEQTKVAERATKPITAERTTDTEACYEVDPGGRELVKVNRTDKDGNGEILIYAGPTATRLTLSRLVDFNKLRAIKLDKGPVDVYLGSIATDVVFNPEDKMKVEHAVYEHYFGIVRRVGVVSSIGCVRWPGVASRLITEGRDKGMVDFWLGMYPPLKKPKELRAGVLSPKERVINF